MRHTALKVDENMRRAHERNAATEGKFFFRNNVDYAAEDEGPAPLRSTGDDDKEKESGGRVKEIYEYSPCDFDTQKGLEEMTLSEIMEGKASRRWFCCVVLSAATAAAASGRGQESSVVFLVSMRLFVFPFPHALLLYLCLYFSSTFC